MSNSDIYDLTMDKIFNKQYGKNKLIFKKYNNIYNLKEINYECEVSDKLFEYASKKDLFILLLIYDSKGKVYLERDLSDKLYWGLPGNSIKEDETIHMAINKISKKIDKDILIGDIEPIAIITNNFRCENKEVKNEGLAFISRLRNENVIDYNNLSGEFIEVNDKELKFINRLSNKEVVEIFIKRFNRIRALLNDDFQEKEISINEKYNYRYKIHNKFMKRYILTNKRKRKAQYKEIISKLIGDPKSIIDVSCGDDKFIFDLSREKSIPIVVGNDISWSQIELLNKKYSEILFTNHNAAALPFKDNIFDVAFCRNTLHHMTNRINLISLLENMLRISKKIIIVEIEDPKIKGGFPLWLNKKWFIGFLKDVGGAYLSENDFSTIIQETFENKAIIRFKNFKNIMGNYMIAEITKEDNKCQV